MSEARIYKCRKIVKGCAAGEAIVSKEALCFYMTDPSTGVVTEKGHVLEGRSAAGKILAVKSGKGSTVVQVDGFYKLMKNNKLPKAIIIQEADPVIVSAAVMTECVMVDRMEVCPTDVISDGDHVEVDADGGMTSVTSAS